MTLERDIEKKLVRFCAEHKLLCYKFTSPAHRGVPDRIIFGRGRTLLVELKRPGAPSPTMLQMREISRINNAGVPAFWSDNWDEIEARVRDEFQLLAA